MSLGPVMLDIEGLSLSPADRDLLREPAVGGVILFTRNYQSPEQIADLVAEIRALRSPPLLVAVDHEGGRVQRFRDGFTAIPPMRRIGREYDRNSESGLRAAREAGWLIASELRAVGIDLCFAPCVDLRQMPLQRCRTNSPGACAVPAWRLSQSTSRVTVPWLRIHT
jgi:beta-N-acetylhexosaminidase